MVAALAAASINFTVTIVFHREETFATPLVVAATTDLTENREIYIPHVFSTPPRRTPSEFRNILWKLE